MKPLLPSLVSTALLMTAIPVQAKSDLPSPIPIISTGATSERMLTTTDDVLPGETSSRTYTYTILTDESPDPSKKLSLDWSHSELLIPPSALTVEIDGEPVESIALTNDTSEGNLQIKLKREQLTKGTHEVTVRYTGILRGRMCDTGNTTGSWFTVRPSSFVSLGNKASLTLNDYPNPFTQTFNDQLTIVVPNEPNAQTLEAGLLLYRQLKGDATDSDNVSIQYERQLETFDGRYVFIGEAGGFTDVVGALIKRLDTPVPSEGLLLKRASLIEGKASTDAMFILAEEAASFEGTLDHLLIERQRQQLNGESLVLTSSPVKQDTSAVVPLRSLGASNLLLSGSAAVSPNYFYPLPALGDDSNVTLDVMFKLSDNLRVNTEEQVMTDFTAWINGVPYSIPLNDIQKDSEWQQHAIQVDTDTLKRSTFLDVSFEANGLRSEGPCTSSDTDRWIYVSDDSRVTLPSSASTSSQDAFLNMASLFTTGEGIVLVVPDGNSTMELSSVANVMSGLPITPLSGQIEVVRAQDVTEDLLTTRSIIFIGNPETTPLLQDQKEKWLVTRNDAIDLAQYGFVPETSEEYAWIQPSLWNDELAMIVIATDDTVDPSLMQTIVFPNETFSLAVKNSNGSVFTNSQSISEQDTETAGTQSNERQSISSVWYFAGFITLLVAILVILFMMRRKKV
ncbi:hypothetical protein EVJ33_07045 [Exiguobacterium sp. SL-10]|uniref:cellulose biosynthesis cyclic di-GMP-binding regulatory protein BcsB n=1 Tax=unclassified Exiguobacterium TaxID=2644629 RepID=UPI00103FB592|nr:MULTISPECIES: cellulose biosynthesis cyclic di-GMP-binding regulatory protein BcsB [unclassified Exiguobacterium]TCI22614.1 hypothetical protein EVJ34_08360 [Exiguobacterium sp. SL-9]TCI30414.1 hypothetical protein EVJ33_07045 [Exiguobacterium sp. SL-10]